MSVPLSFIALSGHSVLAGQYVQVSPDLTIHYEDRGSGQPILFIPGWTGSTEYMTAQLDHFAKEYRAISYDPRGQGLSTKTLEGNHYLQHGADLAAFIEALDLGEVILAAHSAGCADIYAYVRAHGVEKIKAMIAIDCVPPRPVWTQEGDWSFYKDAKDLLGSYAIMTHSRVENLPGFFQWMVSRELTAEEIGFFTDMAMKTPDPIATLLRTDWQFSDYIAEAKLLDENVPFLYVLNEGEAPPAQEWLRTQLPNTRTFVLGHHNMHWEFPDAFNTAIETFLNESGVGSES